MSAPLTHLRRWQEAGLVDDATAARIKAFEAAPDDEEAATFERPTFTEALLYLGVVVIAVGVVVLAATNWGHLGSWGRVAVPGVPAVIALLAGWWMRREEAAPVQRGASAAWFVAPGLAAGATAVFLNETGVREENMAMVSAIVMMAFAAALWWLMPRSLQVISGAASSLLFSLAVAAETSRVSERWALTTSGFTILGFGALAFAAVELGFIKPRIACQLLAAIAITFGSFFVTTSTPIGVFELAPFVAGILLVWLSVELGFFPYTVAGVVAIFLGTFVTIIKHVPDPTLAALALMFSGVVMIAVVVLIARMRHQDGHGGMPLVA